jgi:coatomer subunit beta'
MYLLGYVPKEDRVFLIDTTYNIVSYKLLLNVLNYQTAVVRKDFDAANIILASIPRTEHAGIARFLESQGFKEEALTVSTDLDHKFELAVDLRKMNIAHEVLVELEKKGDTTDTQSKWRRLGDLALSIGDITLGKQCADKSDDLSGLLLLFSSSGNKAEMISLAKRARAMGRYNVSFIAFFITNQIEDCIEMLIDTKRIPEAAFMARTYAPSEIPRVLELWKNDLKQINEKAADSLADPFKYPNLFPDLDYALKIEETFKSRRGSSILASSYPTAKADLELNLIELMKNNSISIDSAAPAPAPAQAPLQEEPTVSEEEPTISEEEPTISEEEPAVEEATEEVIDKVIEEEVVENEIEDVEELENEDEQQKVVSDLNTSNNEEDEDWA